jgi:hypothetical protein
MNVRRMSATTFSLAVLIIGLYFLIPEMRHILPNNVLYSFYGRLPSQYYIGSYHSFILSASAWLIVVVGIIDAILYNRVALNLLPSFKVSIVLIISIIVFLFIPVNNYIFWGLVYIALILGILWIFRMVILNNHPSGKKLIPFIKEIKEGVGAGANHISDRYTVFGVSILLTGVYVILLVSLIVYVIAYRNRFV